MKRNEVVPKLLEGAAAVAIWSLCVAFIVAIRLGLGWLVGPPPLDPPGEECEVHYDDFTGAPSGGQCWPLPGWHFEEALGYGRIAVQDLPASLADRQKDIDTARYWRKLNNEQRQRILDGEADIYDFVDPRTK